MRVWRTHRLHLVPVDAMARASEVLMYTNKETK